MGSSYLDHHEIKFFGPARDQVIWTTMRSSYVDHHEIKCLSPMPSYDDGEFEVTDVGEIRYFR